MSIKNISSEITIGGATGPIGQYPSHILLCVNTPWYDFSGPLVAVWSANPSQDGELVFSLIYGTYAIMADRGGAFGEPHGDVLVDPGYNLNDMGRTDKWTWIWLHRDSLSLRGFRVHDSPDFTDTRAFNAPQNGVDYVLVGRGLPASAKLAHVHFYSALTSAQYDSIRAGTLDPTSLPSHRDGFTFATSYASVKGVLTAAPLSGVFTFDADNPVVSTSGGGGTSVTPGVRTYRSSMGW